MLNPIRVALLLSVAFVLCAGVDPSSHQLSALPAAHPDALHGEDSTACIRVTAQLFNSGPSVLLGQHLRPLQPSIPAIPSRQHDALGSMRSVQPGRGFSISTYHFCIDNELPIATSWVLLAEGYQVEEYEVWVMQQGAQQRVDSTRHSRFKIILGGLPVGLGETAARIDVPAGTRYEVVVRYRGAVHLSLTALRQYYVAAEQRNAMEHSMMLAYLSASAMLLLIVLGISVVILSQTYFYLAAYCIAFTAWALVYSGYVTHVFASGRVLNDQMVPVVLAHITFMLALGVTRALLEPADFGPSARSRYRISYIVLYVLAGIAALELAIAQLHELLPAPVQAVSHGLYIIRDGITIVGFAFSLWAAVPVGISAWRRGYQPAAWLMVSYGATAAVSIPPILYVIGLHNDRNLATACILIGALVQFFFFSLAIGARFRVNQQHEIEALAHSKRQLALQNETLETKVLERTAEIEAMADQLMQQNQVLQQSNHEMVASLEYAERIQRALLPTEGHLHRAFRDHFVLYQPRDIVSGDFFWSHETEEAVVVAVADCTGHGVPGAFLSMISADLLRQIIVERDVSNPAEVLLLLDIGVRNVLRQDESDVLDGLDISLCFFHRKTNELVFAGANHAMYLASGHGNVREVRGTRRTIGEKRRKGQITHAFQSVMLDYADFDTLYLLTDGYTDQFGSDVHTSGRQRKFGRRRLIELLSNVQTHPLSEQREQLLQAHLNWKGSRRQVDDLLVVGMRTR